MIALTLAIAVLLGLVHIFGGQLPFLKVDPRSRSLSAAGGITVAFIFLYLLPELNEFRQVLVDRHELGAFDELIYLVALAGVALFYFLEHFAYQHRSSPADIDADEPPFGHDYVFWVHMAWYALYNVIIGILLSYGRQEAMLGLVAYGVAMSVHFAVIDAAMRIHHRHVYSKTGRWILALAVILGWALGTAFDFPTTVVALFTGFLAGAMLINSVKDELPSGKQTRFGPFILGAAVCAAILLLI